MKHKPIQDNRFFFATAPLPCPYIPGQAERRVVTELVGRDAVALHDRLSLAGYRRSHNIAYAPACPSCDACRAVRVVAPEFRPSKSQRRVQRRNHTLVAAEREPVATPEQFAIFSLYQESRHSGGDMAQMDFLDYQALVEDTPVDTVFVEFRAPEGALASACLLDRVENGLSAVYSFFDPAFEPDSIGTYMILWMIERAEALGLRHVYLGFWIDGCAKMSYKAKFHSLEVWTPGGWQRLAPNQLDTIES